MLTLYFQHFSTRRQNIDLFRLPVELLGKRGDRLDHMFTAIENDKKLSRTNEVDQLQAGVFRFERNSLGCRDSPRNMARIGKAFQVNKIDIPAKLLGNDAANSQGNGRLANAAGAERGTNPSFWGLFVTRAEDHFAPNHHDRPHGEPALVPELSVPAFLATSEGDNGADERVAPSLDVCDVSVAKLAVTKRLADRGHVDPDAPLLHGHVRPDVIDEVLLCDHLTRTLGKVDQDVEGPAAKGQHHTVAPKTPLAARSLKGAKLQISMNVIVSHGSWHGLSVPFRVAQSSAQNPSASLIDVCLLRISARILAQKGISTRRPACGMLTADDAQRFPLANRGRTLSSLWAPPEWGEDSRG